MTCNIDKKCEVSQKVPIFELVNGFPFRIVELPSSKKTEAETSFLGSTNALTSNTQYHQVQLPNLSRTVEIASD
ncbi:hypothetical protein TNCV_3196261 [Trichonephila clavipes]|nr:hypothetical protein TNCV_3196261 [Trichonephila clavipes]